VWPKYLIENDSHVRVQIKGENLKNSKVKFDNKQTELHLIDDTNAFFDVDKVANNTQFEILDTSVEVTKPYKLKIDVI